MRKRLSKRDREAEILKQARALFMERGLARTEMEDIRLACGISRGGLYHHFPNKRAVLEALVAAEVHELADSLDKTEAAPILTLLRSGSSHLGAEPGLLSALHRREERIDYLSALDQAFSEVLRDALAAKMRGHVRDDVDPDHVTELFLTVTAHINRREILGQWSPADAAGFAATSLRALAPLMTRPDDLQPVIAELEQKASAP